MSAAVPTILMLGTGGFGSRILFDIVACAQTPLKIVIAGRNPDRLLYLRDAARGRADIFGRDVGITLQRADLSVEGDAEQLLNALRPDVVVQAASAQAVGALRSGATAWTDLIQNGGYSASMVFQAIFSARIAKAIKALGLKTALVNCCYPDVVNEALASIGLPVTSGVGNISILAHILRGNLPIAERDGFRLLAHYRNLRDWRVSADQRGSVPCRIWMDDVEVEDVYARFPVTLSTAPVPDVSGASAAPYIVALATGGTWSGHLSATLGLPGGYPARLEGGVLGLDLPKGASQDEAVTFNRQFEAESGAVVDVQGNVTYTGKLKAAIARHSEEIAGGFNMSDLEEVYIEMCRFRNKLSEMPV